MLESVSVMLTVPPAVIARSLATIPPAVPVTVLLLVRWVVATFRIETSEDTVIAPAVGEPISRRGAVMSVSSALDRSREFAVTSVTAPRSIASVVVTCASVTVPLPALTAAPIAISSAVRVIFAPVAVGWLL